MSSAVPRIGAAIDMLVDRIEGSAHARPGDMLHVEIHSADDHDLFASLLEGHPRVPEPSTAALLFSHLGISVDAPCDKKSKKMGGRI